MAHKLWCYRSGGLTVFFCLIHRFNAVVSKTVNNHGDHAYSITGHARHFYPIGHGIKINHYFPERDYTSKNVYTSETEPNVNEKPVSETEESKIINDGKMIYIENGNIMVSKPEMSENMQEKVEISNPLLKVEKTSVKVVPTVVSMTMLKTKPEEGNEEITFAGENKTDNQVKEEVPKLVEEKKSSKEEQSSDSEVASSYYHSRIYYVGY